MRSRSFISVLLVFALVAIAACGGDDAPDGDAGSVAGVGAHVLVTLDGPLVGADVSIDHLEFQGATPMVRSHIGDVTTDGTGYFHIGTGTKSGYFLITTRGGQFKDYATGQAIVLDASDELTAILYTDSLEDLTTGMVTPIAHLAHKLIVARTAAGTDATLIASHTMVNEHLDAHFGGLAWERGTVGDLSVAAPSPTADVRAAFILAAWSLIAQDIASAAGSTAQEINPYTLAIDLGRDLGAPPFDGNDSNERASGTGVQFGACPAAPGACVPMGTCDLGDCRSKCDAYANTTRTVLATWLANVINDSEHNQTGLTSADTLSFVRAVASNADPILFGSACVDVEGVDLEPPTFTWGAMPVDGAVIRGAVTWTVTASDNVDPAPVVTWLGGLPDNDGTASGAATTIDTTLAADGPRSVTAHAVDESGNANDETRMIVADNTAPALTVATAGFLPDGSTWWTALDAPHLTGTVTDAQGPITIEARILGAVVASASFPGGAWDLALPAGSIAAAGSTVVVRAVDAVGNTTVDTAETSPYLRVDSAAPTIEPQATTFYDESNDSVTYPGAGAPVHTHSTVGATALGLVTSCPTVKKYAYLTDIAPAGTEASPNPIALRFRASDAGIGLDLAAFSYRVTAPNLVAYGPFPLTPAPVSGAPGSYDATAELRRNGSAAVPSIGDPAAVLEGVYTVTYEAKDLLGRTATLARCFTLTPLGPPLRITRAGQAATADANGYIRTLDYYKLTASPGPTAELLNGTAVGGVLSVRVSNATGDPAFVKVLPPVLPSGAQRYSKTLRTYLQPTTQATVSVACLDTDPAPPALCSGFDPLPRAITTVTSQPLTGAVPSVKVHQFTGGAVTMAEAICTGCSADEYRFDPGTEHEIVLGFSQLSNLALDIAGAPSQVDGFTAILDTPSTTASCITAIAIAGGTRCTRVQNYRQYRSLASATVELTAAGGSSMRLDWQSSPSAVAGSFVGPSLDAVTATGRGLPVAVNWNSSEIYP